MTAPLLNSDRLALLRRIQDENMTSQCDLVAYVSSRGPGGVDERTYIVVDTVPCRLTVLGSTLPIVAVQPTPAADYLVYLPVLTDTTGISRLRVRGTAFGQTWAIELVDFRADEPRTFAASRRVHASLARDIAIPPTPVALIVVTDIPPVIDINAPFYPRLTLYPSITLYPAAA